MILLLILALVLADTVIVADTAPTVNKPGKKEIVTEDDKVRMKKGENKQVKDNDEEDKDEGEQKDMKASKRHWLEAFIGLQEQIKALELRIENEIFKKARELNGTSLTFQPSRIVVRTSEEEEHNITPSPVSEKGNIMKDIEEVKYLEALILKVGSQLQKRVIVANIVPTVDEPEEKEVTKEEVEGSEEKNEVESEQGESEAEGTRNDVNDIKVQIYLEQLALRFVIELLETVKELHTKSLIVEPDHIIVKASKRRKQDS